MRGAVWSALTSESSKAIYRERNSSLDANAFYGQFWPVWAAVWGQGESTLLDPQSRFGDKPLKFQVICPQNGTAVLKGLSWGLVFVSLCAPQISTYFDQFRPLQHLYVEL